MPRAGLFRKLCGARLHGRPGQTCRQSPVPGRKRCKFHGGLSPRGPRPRLPGQQKPGPKPRDPGSAERRKARAELMRTRPDLARNIPILEGTPLVKKSAPHDSPALDRQPGPPQDDRPPWPRNGYAGSLQSRDLEADERRFIRELAAPVDLEAKLMQATDYERVSCHQAEALLTAFVQGRQQYVGERLAVFADAEAMFRSDGAEDCRMRLERLRFEADAYLGRLAAAKLVLVLRLEERERRDHERAYAMTEAATGHLRDRAELRSSQPRQEERPRSIAPWLRR